MQTVTNVFLDFDNTQFEGHFQNALTKYLNNYKDDSIKDLSKERLRAELTGESSISNESEIAILEALRKKIELNEDNGFDFFDGKRLNEVVGELKRAGATVMVLTTSSYPNVIRTVYRMNELSNLQSLSILRVPITTSQQIAQDKISRIQKLEDELLKGGYDKVVNFFVDSSKYNIDEFKKGRDLNFNFGIHAKDGMTEKVLSDLKRDVIALLALHKETIPAEKVKSKKADLLKFSKVNKKDNKKINLELISSEKNIPKKEAEYVNIGPLTEKAKQQSKSNENLLSITGKVANKSVLTKKTKQLSKSNDDLLSAGLKSNKNNRDSDIFGQISSKGVLTTSKEKYTEVKPSLLKTFKGIFKKEKKNSEASSHTTASTKDLSKLTAPANKKQEIAKQHSDSATTRTQSQSQTVDKTKGAIPKKTYPQVALKPQSPKH
ncbi:hypothetical protein [Flavobacterium poyangense]|uniref:hypothetical protein n=1 Tax=Flavobacterium poyangense TaxID=2204302 RepID=UPI00142128ED|nr:hypothetical protein [Flavobacterium sp. JXAS1]